MARLRIRSVLSALASRLGLSVPLYWLRASLRRSLGGRGRVLADRVPVRDVYRDDARLTNHLCWIIRDAQTREVLCLYGADAGEAAEQQLFRLREKGYDCDFILGPPSVGDLRACGFEV